MLLFGAWPVGGKATSIGRQQKENHQVKDELARIHAELGIPETYAQLCQMSPQLECLALVDAGLDVFGRPARLERRTHIAWKAMRNAATADGVALQLVSAFRSYDYQQQLLARKLARGDSISEILKVNAAPGYSEHHSGCALDLGTPGYPHLEENFEQSPAFAWLQDHASCYGFRMSFPRDNPYGVLYEPWHWYYSG
jgi:zinc D-Ala-D-Ala carboxypeptidase